MPVYIEKPKKRSMSDFREWQRLGFTGGLKEYLRIKKQNSGGTFFIKGDLGAHCADCAGVGDYLCDYPVGDGKTCDRPMCEDHSHETAPEVHYCDFHYKEWRKFVESGGVDTALKNVIAFNSEKILEKGK